MKFQHTRMRPANADRSRLGLCSVKECGIDVGAQFLGIGDAEIDHCRLKAFVAKPILDCSNGYRCFVPPGRTGFAKAMEVEMFADRPVFARNCDFFPLLVTPFGNNGSALATVQTCVLCYALQLSKEVIVRTAFFVDKDPTFMWSLLAPPLEQRD